MVARTDGRRHAVPPLPPPREAGRYRVGLVCLGNICRSPMAQVVLEGRLRHAGLDSRVEVVSSGTGGWHVGDPMDARAARLLESHGYDASRHRARQLDRSWFDRCDLLLAMDATNLREVTAWAPGDAAGRVHRFRDFDPDAGDDRDVPDPWYGGPEGFEEVLGMVERTSDHLARLLQQHVT